MRHEFGKIMYELMRKDDKVVLIVADIGFGIFRDIQNDVSVRNRYFNLGICEQAIISAASGMALMGLKPYVYTITPFLVERAFEQVKLDIDQQRVNVKLIGYADYPTQGPTHKEIVTPDIARGLFKNTFCHSPINSFDTRSILNFEYERFGPAFISLKKDEVEI